jgi:GNAT superfamily N-acetyltransferase
LDGRTLAASLILLHALQAAMEGWMIMPIREAQITDSLEIARLCSQLGYDVSESEVWGRLRKILADRDHAVYVMEVSPNEIAGWVHVHGRHLIEAQSFAEIGGLVVDHPYRRKGIGETLMRKCEEWAGKKGYREVRLRSGGHRKEAHAFYSSIGYQNTKWQQVFSLELTE